MIKSKIGKLALIGSIIFSCLLGNSQVSFAVDKGMDYGIADITRADALKIPAQQNSEQFKVPKFDASTIKNLSAKGYDEKGKQIDLDVWDSWPLQNADGRIANYKGYNIVFALAGNPKIAWDTHIYLFYQKVGDTSVDSWKCAGKVFKDSDTKNSNDPILKDQAEEWSGSATMTADGKVRLFYTNRHPLAPERGFYGKQTLTTAQVNISQPDNATLKVDGLEDLKSIFDGGDGKIYQNNWQFVHEKGYLTGDNHTFRDPHYIEDNGHKYLVFEANTGTEDGYQSVESLSNKAYYGGDDSFFQSEKAKLLAGTNKDKASLANGVLGMIELNDDYTLKTVMKPLIASNTVTDEIERANVFKMNGKWYLFTDSRGNKMTINGIGDKDIYMLGFESDSLTGPYTPLNDSGLVLHLDVDPANVTFTYSHFAVPQEIGNDVVITSYMTNRGYYEDHHSTFAPSFLVNINDKKTSVVPNSITEQGQLTVK